MSVSYDKTSTLRSQTKHHEPIVLVYESHGQDCRYKPLGDVCSTVSQKYGTGGGNVPIVLESNQNDGTATTLTAQEKERPLTATSIVRRLTPKECERLQGMPDDWSKYGINEKGKVYELPDSARYRLQGNGIATPFWKYLLKRISAQYERDPTMGSLFDGQASFPMLWEGINGSGSCLWSSEIEKHAVAVAKYHFPED